MRCRDVRHDQRDWRLPHHGPHAEDVSQKRTGRRREEQGGGEKVNLTYLIDAIYLLASVRFILGLKGLSNPDTARRGMIQAEDEENRRQQIDCIYQISEVHFFSSALFFSATAGSFL